MNPLTRLAAAALILALLGRNAAAQQGTLTFSGVVLDSLKKPLKDAVVLLPALDRTTTTNDKGVFRIEGLSAGSHRVSVRRIGFTQVDTLITLREGAAMEWRVTLGPGKLVVLDSVIVTAADNDPLMARFEEQRRKGIGRFLSRADLAKKEGASLGGVMGQVAGVGLILGNGGQNWLMSKRAPATRCRGINDRINALPAQVRGGAGMQMQDQMIAETEDCARRERVYYVPEQGEKHSGVRLACYAQVYQDRTLVNFGRPTMPFDLNSLPVDRIEAIEWYESPSQTPAEYAARGAHCGVLIVHTRRDVKKH